MSVFSSINPLTFAGRESCAWNAIQAAYLFGYMEEDERQEVRDLVTQKYVEITGLRADYGLLFDNLGAIGMHALYSLAMQDIGYVARLSLSGTEGWLNVKNPFTQCRGSQDNIQRLSVQPERGNGVVLPDLIWGVGPFPPKAQEAEPIVVIQEREASREIQEPHVVSIPELKLSGFVDGPRGTPAIDLELRVEHDLYLYALATDASNRNRINIELGATEH